MPYSTPEHFIFLPYLGTLSGPILTVVHCRPTSAPSCYGVSTVRSA